MTLQNIQQIPIKEKKFMLQELCLMYRKLKSVNDTHVLRDSGKKINTINEKTISMFDTIIALLPEEQARIIESEFVNGRKIKWQDQRWSKTSYYKFKNMAIDQFLYLFFA